MKKILLLLVFAMAIASLAQAQTTYYVTTSGDDINNNGLSWGMAFRTVQKALDAAVSGDEIWVAAGTYYPDEIDGTDSNNPNATFLLKSGVALYGGFVGTEAALADRPTPLALTILSGDIDKNDTNTDGNFVAETSADIQGTNAKSVVTGDGVDNTAILDGFTITAGDSRGTIFVTDAGGGMFNTNGANPIVRNATFIGNAAKDGGGMFNQDSSPTVTNTTFSGNTATADGGGMYNLSSSPVVTNTTFLGNTAAGNGGGMYNRNNSPTITNATFIGNTANFDGGGMYNVFSDPTITNTTFSGNTANFNGGGMYNFGSAPTITNTTFSGNTAAGNGGGMYNLESAPTITNTILSGNSANFGGGIYNFNGTVTLQNSILWENAPRQIYNEADANDAILNITHTILQGGIGSIDVVEFSGGNSIINDNGGNKSDDPQFITPVNPADAPTTAGNLRLKPTSPAINMGDNAADLDGTGAGTTTIADIATDLDGNPRIFPDAAAIVDMGAYEVQGGNITVVKTASPTSAGTSFSFSGDLGNFSLDGSNDGMGNEYAVTGLPPNSYTITEAALSGWTLADISISGDTDDGSSINLELGTIDVDLDVGEDITITFTNDVIPPSFSKAFAPAIIGSTATSTLTFTIDNSASPLNATNLDFTDNLPAGVVVAATPNASTTCTGGTLTATAGTGTITYTGGTVTAGASCTVSVDVTSSIPGMYANTTGDLTSSLGNSGMATAASLRG